MRACEERSGGRRGEGRAWAASQRESVHTLGLGLRLLSLSWDGNSLRGGLEGGFQGIFIRFPGASF